MGGGGGDTPAVAEPTPAPTKDDAQQAADQETSLLRRRGRNATKTGASGEPGANAYAPTTSILSGGGTATSLGSAKAG